jgi:hypothetical protein
LHRIDNCKSIIENRKLKWARQDSNLGPRDYESPALPLSYRPIYPINLVNPRYRSNRAAFLAELRKVRVPSGEGETNNKALEAVTKLSPSELPVIPGMPDAPESWRRVVALHRLSHQTAYNINLVLERLGVIKIVRVGDARPNGKASQFRYRLLQSENGAEEDDGGLEI